MGHHNILARLAAVLLLHWATSASALDLSFAPATASRVVGQSIGIDIVVSGLNGSTPNLAVTDYDLDINFNPGVLSFDSFSFGTRLGSADDDFPSFTDFTVVGDVIDLAEVSFLDYTSLRTLQGNSFVLGTMSFTALAAGVSNFSFVVNSLATLDVIQAEGQIIPDNVFASATLGTAEITVSNVPEPSSLLLLLLGLAALAACRSRLTASARKAPAEPCRG